MATSKLTAEGIIGEAVRIGAKMSSDGYKYYHTLGLKLIHRGFFRQDYYGLPLKELEV